MPDRAEEFVELGGGGLCEVCDARWDGLEMLVLKYLVWRGERIKESIPFRRAEDEKVRRVDPVILLVADSQAALLAHNVLSAECLDIISNLI